MQSSPAQQGRHRRGSERPLCSEQPARSSQSPWGPDALRLPQGSDALGFCRGPRRRHPPTGTQRETFHGDC